MRIAIVINTSWNIFNFRKGLIKALLDKGHVVYAISPMDVYSEKLAALGVKHVPLEMNAKEMNPFKDFLLMRKFRSLYKELNIDIALHYTIKPNLYGTWACRNINTKSINNVSGLGTTFIRTNWVSKLVKKLYRFTFRFSDYVFFQNHEDKKLFLDLKLVSSDKIGLLPGSGIRYQNIGFIPKNSSSDPIKFLFPARVLIDKGVNEFLEATEKVKKEFGESVEFIMCGKPEPNPKLGLSSSQLEQHQSDGFVTYLGHVDDMLTLMREVDCVVLPSYREGTPRVLLEAACVGRFMITTDAPGCREVVSHKMNGLLCAVKDTNSLYNCMLEYLSMSHELRNDMILNARRVVEEKFDEQIVIKKYNKAIETI